jgi:hypothetical protein
MNHEICIICKNQILSNKLLVDTVLLKLDEFSSSFPIDINYYEGHLACGVSFAITQFEKVLGNCSHCKKPVSHGSNHEAIFNFPTCSKIPNFSIKVKFYTEHWVCAIEIIKKLAKSGLRLIQKSTYGKCDVCKLFERNPNYTLLPMKRRDFDIIFYLPVLKNHLKCFDKFPKVDLN